jgi:D-glycero-alpha-D-manno-heptose 1-phosphate guanylyltransferase
MKNFDRYGVVRTNSRKRITSFEEKKYYREGNINGGIYILRRDLFSGMNLPEKFSFEKDVMENYCNELSFYGFAFDEYFIDIGIPEDYARAQHELSSILPIHPLTGKHHFPFPIDNTWTLFLDRDGVINKVIENDYVRDLDQFEWLDGAQQTLAKLSNMFGRTIIVSNQQGIGKGLMTTHHLETIHDHLLKTISRLGGKIDRIYFAPQLKQENSPMRKPATGMAVQAKKDFPEIDFSKSIMIGDSISDMEFGKKAGMKTVFIADHPLPEKNKLIDFVAHDLKSFAAEILNFKS